MFSGAEFDGLVRVRAAHRDVSALAPEIELLAVRRPREDERRTGPLHDVRADVDRAPFTCAQRHPYVTLLEHELGITVARRDSAARFLRQLDGAAVREDDARVVRGRGYVSTARPCAFDAIG